MSNRRGYVKVELDKTRYFKYDMDALERICEKTGKGLVEILEQTEKLTISDYKVIVWAGLLHENPKLEIDDVNKIVDGQILKAFGYAMKAFALSLGATKKDIAQGMELKKE